MLRALLIGGIGGGVLAFAFGAFSWMASPWMDHDLHKFSDEDAVAAVIQANVTGPGMYYLPYWPESGDAAVQGQVMAKMRRGPLVFAAVRLKGDPAMGSMYAGGLFIQIVTAALVTWMLLRAGIASYGGRLTFVVVFALAAAVVGVLPAWNWWGFSDRYTLILFAEMLAGWLLAGLVIAWATKPSAAT